MAIFRDIFLDIFEQPRSSSDTLKRAVTSDVTLDLGTSCSKR